MQLYHRRKRQQEQQLRSQFSAGDIAKNLDLSQEVTSTPVKDNTGKFFDTICQFLNELFAACTVHSRKCL